MKLIGAVGFIILSTSTYFANADDMFASNKNEEINVVTCEGRVVYPSNSNVSVELEISILRSETEPFYKIGAVSGSIGARRVYDPYWNHGVFSSEKLDIEIGDGFIGRISDLLYAEFNAESGTYDGKYSAWIPANPPYVVQADISCVTQKQIVSWSELD